MLHILGTPIFKLYGVVYMYVYTLSIMYMYVSQRLLNSQEEFLQSKNKLRINEGFNIWKKKLDPFLTAYKKNSK